MRLGAACRFSQTAITRTGSHTTMPSVEGIMARFSLLFGIEACTLRAESQLSTRNECPIDDFPMAALRCGPAASRGHALRRLWPGDRWEILPHGRPGRRRQQKCLPGLRGFGRTLLRLRLAREEGLQNLGRWPLSVRARCGGGYRVHRGGGTSLGNGSRRSEPDVVALPHAA